MPLPIIASDCGDLRAPRNGMVETTGTKYWDTATYSCIAGYYLVGESERTCEDTGLWSGVAPTCQGKCILRNMAFNLESSPFLFLFLLHFLLFLDFFIFSSIPSSSPSSSLSSSLISPLPPPSLLLLPIFLLLFLPIFLLLLPIFLIVLLPYFSSSSSSIFSLFSFTTPLSFSFACNIHSLHLAINCEILDNPNNGRVEFNSIAVRSQANYFCNPGYQLIGESTRICEVNGEWSGQAPFCQRTYVCLV